MVRGEPFLARMAPSRNKRFLLFLIISIAWTTWNTDKFAAEGRKGVGPGNQDWGYVTVRPNAHMFWWLHYTTADVSHFTDRPLILWLQGGPGMPSSGYGNFLEIGPVDLELNEREHSWVKDFNILFIDNPVGVGFSYISNNATPMVTNNVEIGKDLVELLRVLLDRFDDFKTIPMYIFGESYGGKMTVEFALQIHKEIGQGKLRANLQGIGLGDSYISPIDYIMNYAPYALNLGMVDRHGFKVIDDLAKQIRVLISRGDYVEASKVESKITDAVIEYTEGIDIYNILFHSNRTSLPRFLSYQDNCNEFMNGHIREALNISKEVEWSFINDDIYSSLYGDLIKPVTKTVEEILNNTDIKVIVYNGMFDFIVNTPGTANWLDNLNWEGKERWRKTLQESFEIGTVHEGYMKRVDNLVFYTVLRAGHSVPIDNVVAMEEILSRELLTSSPAFESKLSRIHFADPWRI